MAYNFQVSPFGTTNATGSFNIDSAGYIQGLSMDSPSVRNQLAGGIVALTETLPMFGGIAISETVPTGYVTGSSSGPKSLGGPVSRATAITGSKPVTGFTVFDQAHHMVGTLNSPVPLAIPGMSVHFYRLGTGARIPLNCDPSLISLQGGLITQQVSWDFTTQRLVPYVAAYGNDTITAASYNTGTGQVTFTTTAAHGLVAGNDFAVAGMVPTGYNGAYTALTGTTGSTIVAALATNPGSATTFGAVQGGGGALPISILDVAPTNCMTISLDPVSGLSSWNRNGACALALI
jgi:hypothetical protein